MCQMAKTTSINLRVTPEFRAEIEELADFHGLSLSSYTHSLLVKAVRHERTELRGQLPGVKAATVNLAKVAAHIEPSEDSKQRAEIRKNLRKTG